MSDSTTSTSSSGWLSARLVKPILPLVNSYGYTLLCSLNAKETNLDHQINQPRDLAEQANVYNSVNEGNDEG